MVQAHKYKQKELTAGDITKTALLMLKAQGYHVWRQTFSTKRRNTIKTGVPDIIGHHKVTGIFVGCEIKTINDRFSDDQIEFLTCLHQAEGTALYATEEKGDVVIKEFATFLTSKSKNNGTVGNAKNNS